MDGTDLKILAILQEDASVSVGEIAGRVGLSQTPCWRRIQRLEESGVIRRRVALLDPERDRPRPHRLRRDRDRRPSARTGSTASPQSVLAMPEVMEVHRMAGDVDYLLRVAVANMSAYDDFYRRLIADAADEERHLALRHGAGQGHHRLPALRRRRARARRGRPGRAEADPGEAVPGRRLSAGALQDEVGAAPSGVGPCRVSRTTKSATPLPSVSPWRSQSEPFTCSARSSPAVPLKALEPIHGKPGCPRRPCWRRSATGRSCRCPS